MKLFWKAAFAVVVLMGACLYGTAPSVAGQTSRSETITLGTKGYHGHNCRCRKHARHHRIKRHRAYHSSHKSHCAYHSSHKSHRAHRHRRAVRHHYSRRIHGPRYRTRRSGYTYHYGGYWYAAAWWVPVRGESYHGRHLSHDEWCYRQYGRYYHARSNTYLASDGNAYRCPRPSGW